MNPLKKLAKSSHSGGFVFDVIASFSFSNPFKEHDYGIQKNEINEVKLKSKGMLKLELPVI